METAKLFLQMGFFFYTFQSNSNIQQVFRETLLYATDWIKYCRDIGENGTSVVVTIIQLGL